MPGFLGALRGAQWHIVSILEDNFPTRNKESIIAVSMVTGAFSTNSFYLSPFPNLDFQGKADGRIIPPDLSPWSDKTPKKDGGKLRERKKVASIRL